MKILLLFVLCVSFFSLVLTTCNGKANTQPIYTTAPKLVNTSQHGKLYVTNANDPGLYVLHVYGSPYDLGYAHGALLREQIQEMVPAVIAFMGEQIDDLIKNLPDFMKKAIKEYGVEAALFLNYEMVKSFIPKYWIDEIQGIADGSGVAFTKLMAIHMLPEITQASCSIIGAWGAATNNKTNNGPLYQLRALDWETRGPFQRYPVFLVYHPDQGHEFAIQTWSGFIGAITGFSSVPLAISEKVWLEYKGYQNRVGYPFYFLLRDILQFDNSTDDAINRISRTIRTCSIWIGVGTPPNDFKIIQYAFEYFTVLDEKNFPTWEVHPSYKNLLYVDKHSQPSKDDCMGGVIKQIHGNINAINIFQQVTALSQTGDMQIAVYDFENMFVYVSNAGVYDKNKPTSYAYDRVFTKLDAGALFNEKL